MQRQNSERIFLEPIDQLYDTSKTKDSPDYDDQSKFFEDYTHGVMDYLNISTDSETKNNSIDEDIIRLGDILSSDWKNKADYFKSYQLCVLRSCLFHKMNFLRSSLNMANCERSQSCHTVMIKNDWQAVSPFNLRKESDDTVTVDENENGGGVNGDVNKENVIKKDL
jgi:hypothetical protein